MTIPLWVPFGSVALGVVLGVVAAEIRDTLTRRRVQRQHFQALAAEIRICGAIAAGFIKGGIRSPAYRMPLLAHEKSLPIILAEGELSASQADALGTFYINAKAFNLCLDNAAAAHAEGNTDRLNREVRRTEIKAKKLASLPGTHYERAIQVISQKLPRADIQRLNLEMDEEL